MPQRSRSRLASLIAVVVAAGCDPEVADDASIEPGDAAFDLLEALELAADAEPGGISIEAELTDDGDGLIYDVDRVIGDETREILIDANTGEIVDTRVDPDDQAEGRLQADALAGSTNGVTLDSAIMAALAAMPGVAVSAETELEDGVILVVLLEGESSHAVAIDLQTGAVVDTAVEPVDD